MRLLHRPARASTWLLGELLRAEAVALSEVGRLTQGLGSILEEALTGGRERAAPDDDARRPDVREGAHASGDTRPEPIPMPSRVERVPRTPRVAPPAVPTPPASVVTSPAAPEQPAIAASEEASAEPPGGRGGHVDEQAVLVAESADPGAQDGAGASVHVREPWSGYRTMRAPEIVDRLPALPDEVLSLVLLYETKPGRARRTVLRAAQRELERRAA
jgi:hypothetical protein